MSHAFVSKISYRYSYIECIEIYRCVYIYVYIKHVMNGRILGEDSSKKFPEEI